jgi:hypothetical protein
MHPNWKKKHKYNVLRPTDAFLTVHWILAAKSLAMLLIRTSFPNTHKP